MENLERYEVIELNRKELKNAPYNPRVLSDKVRKKLQANIKKVGLLQPCVWNEVTGNIVAGHQRISILDSLYRTQDYTIKVSKVHLDEKTEKEQVVFMNNPNAMGDWDLEKLEKLFTDDKIDIEMSGFDLAEVYQLFGDNPLSAQPGKLAELSDQLRKSREVFERVQKRLLESDDEIDAYLVVVFRTHEDRRAFTDALKLPDNRFVDGREIQNLIPKGPKE